MRTTVSLDDDLARRIKTRAHERGTSFKVVLNEALRTGLAEGQPSAKPYRVNSRSMRVKPGINLTKALQLAGELEDEEILRKLEQGR